MQISTDVIGFKKSFSLEEVEKSYFELDRTKSAGGTFSLIAIKLKSLIPIKLKIDGQRAMNFLK